MSLVRYLLQHPFIRFAVIGAFGSLVDMGVLTFDTGILHMDFEYGRALSIFAAMCFTWAGNRYLTFRDQRARGLSGTLQEWLKFVGANSVGALVNYGISVLVVHFTPYPFDNKYAALVAGVLAGMTFNFTLSKKLVFKAPI